MLALLANCSCEKVPVLKQTHVVANTYVTMNSIINDSFYINVFLFGMCFLEFPICVFVCPLGH